MIKVCGLAGCGALQPRLQVHRRDLLLCSRCKRVSYCSKEHPVKHWQVHKKDCKAWSEADKNAETAQAEQCGEKEVLCYPGTQYITVEHLWKAPAAALADIVQPPAAADVAACGRVHLSLLQYMLDQKGLTTRTFSIPSALAARK